MDLNSIVTMAGVFIGAALAAYLGYSRKLPPPKQQDSVITGVGMELGSRAQGDMIVAELHRIGDILENKKQAGIEETLKRLVEEIDDLRETRR